MTDEEVYTMRTNIIRKRKKVKIKKVNRYDQNLFLFVKKECFRADLFRLKSGLNEKNNNQKLPTISMYKGYCFFFVLFMRKKQREKGI